jgi:hypothetical protein
MEEKFTIAEFRNYIHKKCNSFGDVSHFLTAENIRKANEPEEEEIVEEEKPDRYEIKTEIEDDFRIVSIIDKDNNNIEVKTVKIPRAPFSGGISKARIEMEDLCDLMNEQNDPK